MLRGVGPYVKAFIEVGAPSDLWFIYLALIVEFVGGLCIAIGLFTRFWAAAAAIELAYITWIYLPNGFSWLARGWEFSFMWGLICFAIALRGGGPYSVDRAIGREL